MKYLYLVLLSLAVGFGATAQTSCFGPSCQSEMTAVETAKKSDIPIVMPIDRCSLICDIQTSPERTRCYENYSNLLDSLADIREQILEPSEKYSHLSDKERKLFLVLLQLQANAAEEGLNVCLFAVEQAKTSCLAQCQ